MDKRVKLIIGLGCIFLILSFLFVSIHHQSRHSFVSQEIRNLFKEQLTPLPEPPFELVLGYKPSEDEIELGKMLFNDPVLSRNNDVSCATCHLSNHGFADGNRLNFGALGKGGPSGHNVGKSWADGVLSINRSCGDDGFGFHCVDPMFRNSLSTVNVVYRAQKDEKSGLLWDGRFGDLSFQVLLPIHTLEEMCGTNPIPLKDNPFKKGGFLFDQPVYITHSHFFNPQTGQQLLKFNSEPQWIEGVPAIRPNGGFSYPARNECLAIAVAKLRKIKFYRKAFKKVFNSEIKDKLIGRALASFVSTHISNNTPYDRFVQGQDSLSIRQMEGMAIFLTPAGKDIQLSSKTLKGAGCVDCHSPPHFGGEGFYSLGISGDFRSSLSRPNIVFGENSGFFPNLRSEHGPLPSCHIVDDTVMIGFRAPDIGRAIATFKTNDCFQFRVPTLRNVIETFPYFHHGTETARQLSRVENDFKQISAYALKRAIQYHLDGPFSIWNFNRVSGGRSYNDESFQIDSLIPWERISSIFRVSGKQSYIDEYSKSSLFDFVAYGLYDKRSTQRGYFNNDVSHPKKVPSGFSPSITRDQGHQKERLPHADEK